MHRSRRTARRGFAVALAALLAGAGSSAEAASLVSTIRYGTTGAIGSDAVSGPNVVRFVGVDQASAITPSPFQAGAIPASIPGDRGSSLDLGRFEVVAATSGAATVYDHTPFAIALRVEALDGASPVAGRDPVVVHGWLDGTVGGAHPSPLVAYFQLSGAYGLPWEPSDDVGNFAIGLVNQTLTIPGSASALALPIGPAGSTELTGVLVGDTTLPSPAPEPATLLIFVAAAAGLALRGRARSRSGRG